MTEKVVLALESLFWRANGMQSTRFLVKIHNTHSLQTYKGQALFWPYQWQKQKEWPNYDGCLICQWQSQINFSTLVVTWSLLNVFELCAIFSGLKSDILVTQSTKYLRLKGITNQFPFGYTVATCHYLLENYPSLLMISIQICGFSMWMFLD